MTRQITFRRIRSARALTTAVLCSALVLIAVITFYPERFGHAANHKRQRLAFEDHVVAQRAIEEVYHRRRIWPAENPHPKPPLDEVQYNLAANVWTATNTTNAPNREQNNDSVKVARAIDAWKDAPGEWRSIFNDKYFRVDGITHLFDLPPKMAVPSTSVKNMEVAALLQTTKTVEKKTGEGIHWKEAAFAVALVILLMSIPIVVGAFKEMKNPSTIEILAPIGFGCGSFRTTTKLRTIRLFCKFSVLTQVDFPEIWLLKRHISLLPVVT